MRLANPEEIAASRPLRGLASFLCLYYWITWKTWTFDLSCTSLGRAQSLYLPWFFFEDLGWTVQWMTPELYRIILGALALISLATALSFQTDSTCRNPQRALALLWVTKLFVYFHTLRQVANYHHMHLLFTAVFLFAQPRLVWLRISLASVYWLAASVKLTPSWLYGEYFNSLPSKLPLLPQHPAFVTLACNLVTALELLAPLAFWSKSLTHRRAAVFCLLLFHLYSGCIVGIWYTSLMVPFLLCLFSDGCQDPLPPVKYWLKSLPGFSLLAVLGLASWSWVIPGDVRFTAEGRYFGLFMFDANHIARAEFDFDKERAHWRMSVAWNWPDANNGQNCRIQLWKDGQAYSGRPSWLQSNYFSSLSTRILNDPYVYYRWVKQVQPEHVHFKLYSALDGHPEEVCTVDQADFGKNVLYQGWWRNPWILLPGPEAPASYRWF